MAYWYYRIQGRDFGPVDDEKLSSLYAAGEIKSTDLVRTSRQSTWTDAGEVLGELPTGDAEDAWSANDLDSLLASDSGPFGIETQKSESTEKYDEVGVDDQWFYKAQGQDLGPVPFVVIQNLVQNGMLTANDFLRPGRSGAWQRAARIAELAADFEAQRAATAATPSLTPPPQIDLEGESSPLVASQPADQKPSSSKATGASRRKKSVGSKEDKRRTPQSKKSAESAEDLAAEFLAEFGEEDAAPERPMNRMVASPRPAVVAAPSTTENTEAKTPSPPPSQFVAPVSIPRPTPRPAAKSSRGISLKFPFDPAKSAITAAIIALVIGGYLIPWGSLIKASTPNPEITMVQRAKEIWNEILALSESEHPSDKDWLKLKKQHMEEVTKHLALLLPQKETNEMARLLYLFEREGVQLILAKGPDATPEMFVAGKKRLRELNDHR